MRSFERFAAFKIFEKSGMLTGEDSSFSKFTLAFVGFLSFAIGSSLIYKGTIINGRLGALIIGASIPFFVFIFFALTNETKAHFSCGKDNNQYYYSCRDFDNGIGETL